MFSVPNTLSDDEDGLDDLLEFLDTIEPKKSKKAKKKKGESESESEEHATDKVWWGKYCQKYF